MPYATTLRQGTAATPAALGGAGTTTLTAAAANAGADVSFTEWPSGAAGGRLMTARFGIDGVFGAPQRCRGRLGGARRRSGR